MEPHLTALAKIVDDPAEMLDSEDAACVRVESFTEAMRLANLMPYHQREIMSEISRVLMFNQTALCASWVGMEEKGLVTYFEIDVVNSPVISLHMICQLTNLEPDSMELIALNGFVEPDDENVLLKISWENW